MRTRTLALIFAFLFLGCMPEFPDIEEKNLCNENAKCADGFVCVCKNEMKICVENHNANNYVLAFKDTICKLTDEDLSIDAEADAERDTETDAETDTENDAGYDVSDAEADSQPDAEDDSSQDVYSDSETDISPDSGDVSCQPSIEICDGQDNNCDGETDEGFNLGDLCVVGEGVCKAEGIIICKDDNSGSVCDAVAGQSSEEICDQLDNDCDGFTDENLPNCCTPDDVQECGLETGECERGTQTCTEDQEWGPCEGAVDPVEESCDYRDNDCDSATDEDFANLGQECQIGQGDCLSSGRNRCSQDKLSIVCDAVEIPPGIESCDNRDNDCDGFTDEELQQECGSDIGECQKGLQACEHGEWLACEGSVAPADELCDGLDNDCDDIIDNGFDVNQICFVGIGECRAEGVIVCNAEDPTVSLCNAVAGNPQNEICDGLDNDCDGETDEEMPYCCDPGPPPQVRNCGTEAGECEYGTETCRQDRSWGWCVGAVGPSMEECNGLDDNCDGQTDEYMQTCCMPGTTRDCGTDEGECQHGTQICWASREWGECNGQTNPVDEICDGLDNNCDSWTDEDFFLEFDPNNCGECNNVCGQQGTTSSECVDGECVLQCARYHVNLNEDPADGCECEITKGAVEVCDQIDNDCDGLIDENCENLILYLSFDRETIQGNKFLDLSGNNNHATGHNPITVSNVGNPWGAALMLNGIDGYAEVADSASMDSIEQEFTFFVSAQVLSSEMGDMVFNKQYARPGMGIENNPQVWSFFTNGVMRAQTHLVVNNQWMMFAAKYSQGRLTTFINGEQNWQGNCLNPAGGIMYIGANGTGAGTKYSHMRIDEFSFYNKALSDEEIARYFSLMR